MPPVLEGDVGYDRARESERGLSIRTRGSWRVSTGFDDSLEAMAFAKVVRTTAIERLDQEAIALRRGWGREPGAGLDTRPYRMDLPASLRWIEVDFPELIDYKSKVLSDEKPVCLLERVSADLSNDDEPHALFARLTRESQNCLVITERVIGSLRKDAAIRPRVAHRSGRLETLRRKIEALASCQGLDSGAGEGIFTCERRL